MAFFEGEAKDSEQVHIGAIIVHRLSLTNAKTLIHVKMESTDMVRRQSLSIL